MNIRTLQIANDYLYYRSDTYDIEGYEYKLFENFMLPDTVKNLAIEYHFDRKIHALKSAPLLHDRLKSVGFEEFNKGRLDKVLFATLRMYRRD